MSIYMKIISNIGKFQQNIYQNTRVNTSTLLSQHRINTLKSGHLTRLPASVLNTTPVCCYSHAPTSPKPKDEVLSDDSNNNDVQQLSESDNHSELDCLYRKIDLEVKGHDPAVINSYEKFVRMAAEGLEVNIGRVFTPPKVITRYTLLKSVHIYKKHRVQYENRTHFRVIELLHLTGSTADTILEYIQRNLPEGMAMKVTRHRIENLPEHINITDEK
ncbi:28S ribosomal protein S10, mitochondrial-like [Argonauta hians]